VVALVHIPTMECEGSFSYTFLPAFVVCFLMMANLSGMRWNLSVVLLCISFMAKNVEHYFMCLYLFFWKLFVHFLTFVNCITCFFVV
jgi:hypothetical protein